MRKIILLLALAFVSVCGAQAQSLTLKDIYIRDPFIMPVEKEGAHHTHVLLFIMENG